MKQILYYISGTFSLVIMMFMIIFSDNGFLDMMKMRNSLCTIEMTGKRMNIENTSLCRQINRLKSDPEYIETIARNEMGMVAEDDVVVLFGGSCTD